ncbi:MAG: hypothetical protein KJ718_04485 [Nanoarchaeota archaeon]|nr:hypothetical protein [Nanoarchaeota archaeon]MBU1051786.1 hypothetical protein [Nanoarchaeota archaeon]MBU1988224.1 hypothetical protein [Nanoarchaeota archaeon]
MLSEDNRVDVIAIIIASLSTILGLITSFAFPRTQVLVLTILTILLPVIYQIGNIFSKKCVRNENKEDFNVLEDAIEEIENENEILKIKLNEKENS